MTDIIGSTIPAARDRTDDDRRKSQNLVLQDLTVATRLFHTADGTAFADLTISGHRETWPIRGNRFKTWLRQSYFRATGCPPGATILRSTLDLLEAKAQFDGPQRSVHLRVAEQSGHIYLDLADDLWRAVKIGPDGWQVIDRPPVRFRRVAGMLPLPEPIRGGSLDALATLLNLANSDNLVLIVGWLLGALRATGPFPLLSVVGEQGSAKTVLCKILKALIDPNSASVRSLSREERDLMIAADHNQILAFDNLSGLPGWLSDCLCRISTGGSFALRRLYHDDEEVLLHAARPILLNGIVDVITRADLADRTIFLTMTAIEETARKTEQEIWRRFAKEHPSILGALLDAVVHGLRSQSHIQLKYLPRMADFCTWVSACEGAFWPPGAFAQAFSQNRVEALRGMADTDTVATAVLGLMTKRDRWIGTAAELLDAAKAPQKRQFGTLAIADWPRTPRALAGRLRRAQPILRSLGVHLVFNREGPAGARTIRMIREFDGQAVDA